MQYRLRFTRQATLQRKLCLTNVKTPLLLLTTTFARFYCLHLYDFIAHHQRLPPTITVQNQEDRERKNAITMCIWSARFLEPMTYKILGAAYKRSCDFNCMITWLIVWQVCHFQTLHFLSQTWRTSRLLRFSCPYRGSCGNQFFSHPYSMQFLKCSPYFC